MYDHAAFGDVFGLKHSLHRGFADAKQFYLSYTAMVVFAAAVVLIPGAPLGLITTAVQALAGLLLPSASVFLLLLCNDREVLGPWVNRPWLNWVARVIVGSLLLLSGILMAATLFPDLNVVAVAGHLALALVILAAAAVPVLRWMARRQPAPSTAPPPGRIVDRHTWRITEKPRYQYSPNGWPCQVTGARRGWCPGSGVKRAHKCHASSTAISRV